MAVEPQVLSVLAYLLEHRHRPVPKEELLDQLWAGVAVGDSVVHRCISRARRLLGSTEEGRPFIVTRGHRGYQFAADVCSALVTEATVAIESTKSSRGDFAADPKQRTDERGAHRLLVGRSDELRILRAAIDQLRAKTGSMITIGGEAGMGKSTLLDEMARYANQRGLRILHGRGSEVAGAPAYWPWIQTIRQLLASSDGESIIGQLGPVAADIAQVVPEIADITRNHEPPRGLAPDQQRFRFFDSVTRLFDKAAIHRPSLLIIDDLHCCDDGTLLLWQLLAETAAGIPLLLACSYRSHELRKRGLLAKVLAESWRTKAATRIDIGGLASGEVDMLLTHTLGAPPSPEVAAHVRERSLGNPFFVTELANHVRALGTRENAASIAAIPPSISALLIARADEAGPRCRSVLERAAVIGRRFNIKLLQAACRCNNGDNAITPRQSTAEAAKHAVSEALAQALTAELVEMCDGEPGSYAFRHLLIRDVLYDSLDQTERSATHRAIAEFILEEYQDNIADHYDEIAHHHLAAAGDGDKDRAREFCVLAAQRATERLSYEEAAAFYDKALAALELEREVCDEQRCELLVEAADSRNRAGDAIGARASFEKAAALARHVEDPALFVRSAIGMAVRFGQPVDFGGHDDSAVELLEEALGRLPETPSPQRAIVMACLSFALYASPQRERARSYSRGSERAARASGDHYALSVALLAKQMMSTYPGDTADAEAATDELIAVAESSGLDEMRAMGQTFRVFRCLESGTGSDELEAAIASHTQLARRMRQPQGLWWVHVINATRALMQGDVTTGDRESLRARELGRRSANSNQLMTYQTQQAQVLMHRGDFAGLFKLSATMAESYPYMQASQVGHMSLLARSGSTDEARDFAAGWRQRDLRGGLQAYNWLFEAACLAELGLLLEDRELCENTYAFLLPHANKNVTVGQGVAYYGPVSRYLCGLASFLASHDAAREHFERAVESARAFNAIGWMASSQAVYARGLLRYGKPHSASEAADLLDQARVVAKRLGHAGLEAELVAAGG